MSIALREIFEKPVDRAIDGVIKADDEASLRIELDEYVITGEIGQRLGQFLDAYNNFDTANGVWISGFFGSGKSHLLKMLALLLENRATVLATEMLVLSVHRNILCPKGRWCCI
jgi:ABC-type bacteriocin/lantibiotic exporter with double-glycine peptidase domain